MLKKYNTEGALVKGYPNRADICRLTGLFWELVMECNALVCICRVPTDSNPADLPTREDKFERMKPLGWERVEVGELTKGLGRDRRAWGNKGRTLHRPKQKAVVLKPRWMKRKAK